MTVGLEQIQSDMIDSTGLVLPDEVIEQFGFDTMHWQLVLKQNAMSAIYLGSNNLPKKYTPLHEAEGIIVINAETIGLEITPSNIQLTGVTIDSSSQKRATQLVFDADTNDLFRALVSVSDVEFRPANSNNSWIHDISDNYGAIIRQIPNSTYLNKYRIEGYITPTMTSQTEGHTSAIQILKPRPEYPLTFSPFVDYPNPGISTEEDDTSLQIRFDPKNRRDSRLVRVSDSPLPAIPKWDLLLPKHLEG